MTAAEIEKHNVECAHSGQRSYERATNVPARTVEAKRTAQGGGVHAKVSLT